MKYCIDFYGKQIDLLNKIDEINIDVLQIKTLGDLEEFCKLHKNQRINLCINDYEEAINNSRLTYIIDFQKAHQEYNIYIRLPGKSDWSDKIKEDNPNIKFYFNTRIIDWDTLLFYLDYGVTDVFIAEAMGFELEKIASKVHTYNVQIRVFPNVAQAARKETDDLLKFWIRPEDTDFYNQYVDVYEFYYDDYEKQLIYYDIYKNDKIWSGDLKEIIIGFNKSIDSTRLVPRFAYKRVKCNRKCMKGAECRMCYHIADLVMTLSNTPLQIMFSNEERKEK